MTDTTDVWTEGFTPPGEWDDDVVTPTAVTPPVARDVTQDVTVTVTQDVTPPVTQDSDDPVTPADADDVTPGGNDPVAPPLSAGQWTEVPDAADSTDGGLGDVIARLTAVVKGSPLLGGGSLAAELADPNPGTWSQHWGQVTRHKNMPDKTHWKIAFISGHLLFTGLLKLTGKSLTAVGDALSWTGKRTDRAGDYFAPAAIFIVLATVIGYLIADAVGQVLSQLP